MKQYVSQYEYTIQITPHELMTGSPSWVTWCIPWQAVYALIGHKDSVQETIPRWCEETCTVVWDLLKVAPETSLGHLLCQSSFDAPNQVLRWLEDRDPACTSDTQGANTTDHPLRVFARCTILAELLDAVNGEGILIWAERLAGQTDPNTTQTHGEVKMSRKETKSLLPSSWKMTRKRRLGASNTVSEGGHTEGATGDVRVCKNQEGRVRSPEHDEPQGAELVFQKGYTLPHRCKPCRDQRSKK